MKFFDNDPKLAWAGMIAVMALLGLTATTVVAMFHWPVEPDVIRATNNTFGNVLTFVLGVFTGASVPAFAVGSRSVARVTATPVDASTEVVATPAATEPQP